MQNKAKSNNYHFYRNKVNVADIWRERVCTLTGEVSQVAILAIVTTNCEKSAEPIVVKKFL